MTKKKRPKKKGDTRASNRNKVPLDKKREAVGRLEKGETAGHLSIEYGVTAAAIYQWRQLFKKEIGTGAGKLPAAAKNAGSVKRAIGKLPSEVQDALTFLREANDLIGDAWRKGREPDDAHVAAMAAYRSLLRLLRKGATEES